MDMAKSNSNKSASLRGLLAVAILACGTPALAAESGTSVYLLGSGVPGTAIMPPLEGIYSSTPLWLYEAKAKASREFVVGGNVVAGLEANVAAIFPALLWVPSTNFLGGTLAIGAVLPVGWPDVTASATLTAPGGGQVRRQIQDDALVVGDPLGTAMLGWKTGNLNLQLSTLVNIPVGNYREGHLANLAFNRWAADFSFAATYHDAESGWDITGKTGITLNGRNDKTDYDSGNDFHVEGSIEKALDKTFSMGVQGYYYKQISDDTGAGAKLGPFRGEVTGVGGTAAANVMLGSKPGTIRVQFIKEFNAKNRLEGSSLWLTVGFPISMKMPPSGG